MKHAHPFVNPWPWPIRPLYWVWFLMDWLDDQDRSDHGKVQVDFVLWVALVLHYNGVGLSIGQLIVFLSAAFGARMWLAMLKSRTITSRENISIVNKVIEQRRSNLDFEPSP